MHIHTYMQALNSGSLNFRRINVQINNPKENCLTNLTESIGKRKISTTEKYVNIWRIMKL